MIQDGQKLTVKRGSVMENGQLVLMEVKLRSHDLKRVLSEEEFRGIVEKVKTGK